MHTWFSEARFGLFVHWGIYSIPARGEWTLFYDDWDYPKYEKFAEQFNPVKFNPADWANTAWDAGMRYIVFTTKHHDGYCMFDSNYTDYKITNSPYGKDITAELIEAFRKKGIKIGFYHSLVDWRHPHFIPDEEHPVWKRGERDFSNRNLKIYQEYLYNTVEQLMSNYGKIDLLFFDYTSKYKDSSEWNPERLLEMIYRLQPEIMVNDRLSFDKKSYLGNYCTPEISVPNAPIHIGGKDLPWETCMTLNNNWGYYEGDENIKPISTVTSALFHCVSKNGNLLLNIGPDSQGLFPQKSIERLQELSEWMEINEESIRGTEKSSYKAPQGYFYTQKGNILYLYLTLQPMGDIILPELNDKIKSIHNLRSGEEIEQITYWGYELIQKDEIRIRPLNCREGDVLKLILKE